MTTDLCPPPENNGFESSVQGLYVTPSTPLPFLKGVVVRSFLIERPDGNLLVYHSPGIDAAASEITARGRPTRLLVNHWHESMYDAPELDVPIFVQEKDRAKTDLPVAGTFSGREKIGDDIELIPTPGHTAGTAMVLWDNGEHRLLFPGDTIWVQGGEWKAVLLPEGDRDAYLATLALLGELDFDLLVPWGSEEGQPYAYAVTREEAQGKLQAIAQRLRDGGNA